MKNIYVTQNSQNENLRNSRKDSSANLNSKFSILNSTFSILHSQFYILNSSLFALLFAFFVMVGGVLGQNINTTTSSGGSWSGTNPAVWTPSGATWNVNVADITTKLASGSVTINGFSGGNIVVANAITYANTTTTQRTLTLTTTTTGNISVNAAINLTAASGTTLPGTNVVLTAGASGSVTISAAITTVGGGGGGGGGSVGGNGGSITVTSGATTGNISITAALNSSGGVSTKNAATNAGNITLNASAGTVSCSTTGTLTANGTTSPTNNTAGGNGGAIAITCSGGITSNQNITATGGNGTGSGTGGAGGNITINDGNSTITSGGANDGISGVINNSAGSGGIGTNGTVTKSGTGNLKLSGTNTYAGATNINAGTLTVGADANLGTAPGSATAGNISFGGGTLATTATFTLSSNRGIVFTSAATIDVASATTLTYGGIAAGSFGVNKTSSGTLILSGANTYTGSTTVTAGVLRISSAERISNSSNLILNGGTFSTGSSTGFSETLGTLQVTENSTLELGTGSHTVTFSASNGVGWTSSKTLTITGWSGAGSATGTAGKVFFGSANTGLTATQLGVTSFTGYATAAMMLSTGECVPTLPGCSGTPNPGAVSASSPTSCSTLSLSSTLELETPITESGYSYQWQESTDNTNWSDISGATLSSYVVSLNSVDKYFRLKVTCSNGGGIGFSSSQLIFYDCSNYCSSNASTTSYSYINNVSFNTINNSSSGCASYTNFTNVNTTILLNQSYTLTITKINNCTGTTAYTGRFAAWIDWNRDGDFADAGEQVLTDASASNGPLSASVTVPADASLGSTRMRCIFREGTTAPPNCGSYTSWGETEDYSLIICANPTISSPSANSTVTKCSGENTSFSVIATTPSGGGSTTYQWQVNTGAGYSNIVGETGATLDLTGVTTSMNGYLYRCIVSSGCGGSATSFVTTLNVGAAPSASAGGSASICGNETATVAGASATNGSIAWTENGTGSITSGSTTTTPVYTPGVGESGSVTLTMTVTGTNTGCTSTTATATYTVSVNPNPAITPGSNPSVCQGTTSASLTYTGMTNGGNQFSVNYDGTAEAPSAGFVDVTNSSTTSSPISLVVPVAAATGTYNGSLTVRNSSTGCSSTSSYPITVTVNKVDVTISANPQVCQGITSANVAFTIVEGTPNEYTIDFDGTANSAGFSDVSYTSFSSSPISVAVPGGANVGTYNGTITFRNSTTGCTEANSFAVVVTESPQVSNFSLSSSNVCAGFGNTITVSSTTLATGSYTLTYDVSGANSATGLTSTLNFTAGSPGTGTFTTGTLGSTGSTTITVTQLTSGCSSSLSSGNTSTFTVNASPATPTASYTGAGTGVCEGSPLTLSATGSTGTYTWSGPNSYATTGATPTVSSTATTSLAGTYSVYATNNGCQSQTATTTVTINTVGITLGSNPSVCLGASSANLTYSGVSGSPSQYSIDYNAAANTAGFTDVSLATLSSSPIVLTVPSNPGAGTYSGTLTVKNTTNGCVSNTSYPISVTVNALPTITLGSSPTICRGASSANLTYSAQSGANQYAIDFDATAEGIGFTDVALTSLSASPVSVTTPTGATNGTYNANVTVKNTTTGCVSNNYAWTITLTSPTVTATASPDAFCTGGGTSTITAAGANTYLWSTNATTTSISPNVTSTTTYTVTGTRTSDGCTAQATATVSVGAGSTLFSENFTSSTANNIVSGAAATNYWTEIGTFTKNKWYVSASNATCAINSSQSISMSGNGSTCTDFNETNTIILYKSTSGSFSTIGKANLLLNFDYKVVGGDANNYFEVVYSTTATPSSVANWTGLGTKYYNQSTATSVQVNLPSSLENQSTVYIGFKYVRAGTSTVPSIDNIVVTGFDLPATPSTPTGAVTSRCTNAAVTNTYTVTAVNGATSYAWAIAPSAAGTITGTTTTGTVTWNAGWTGTATITAAAVNCAGTGSYSSGLSVTISAQPGVTTPTSDQTVCANVAPSALSVTASGGSGTTSYQWYSNTSNSTSGGTTVGTNSNSYSPPASGTSGSTYYYCIVSNNGTNCVNATSPAAAAITVNPIPVGTSSLSTQSICSGQTTTAVSLYTSNNVTGTTFAWTRNKTTEVTGIASSGSGSSIAASTLTNTTLTSQTVVFTITPTGPASSNCPGSTYTVSIVVTPGATVNAGSNIAAGTASTPCKSVSPSAVSLTGASIGGSATDAAWSVTSGTGTLSSTVSSATPGSITYTPGSNESGTVTLTLTTNDPDGAGGCTAVSATKTIFIETPVTITTATDFVNSTTTCGQTSLNLAHDGVSGSGVWEFSASVLPDAASDASITVTAGQSTFNTPITATWNANSQCSNVTKTIQFNQPVTSSISAELTSNNSWLWGGLSTTAWGSAANWYKWDGSKWLLQSSATPGSADRVFMLNNSSAGVCVSASNAPALGTSPSIDDIKVGAGQTISLNSNSLTINGDLINDGTINAGTGTVVFSATSGNQTIGGTQPVTLNNLTLNKNAGNLIVNTPVIVNGTLTMTKGNISNSSLVTLGSSSSATGSLSHTAGTITGAFRRYFANSTGTNYYFPIGNATYTRGVTVNMSQAPGADQYITAEYKSGTPQVSGSALYDGLPLTTADGQLIQNYDEEGYWQIDPKQYDSGIDTKNYTISLQMNNISGVNDYTKTRIIKADGPSHVAWSALTHVSATGSNSNFTLSGSGNGFSWFNGGGDNNNNPLPVELVSFTGACDEGIINLTWQTASEFNSSHFDVEKSRDGENWQLLTTLPSAGTSNELITY